MSLDFGVREFGLSPVSKVNDAVRVWVGKLARAAKAYKYNNERQSNVGIVLFSGLIIFIHCATKKPKLRNGPTKRWQRHPNSTFPPIFCLSPLRSLRSSLFYHNPFSMDSRFRFRDMENPMHSHTSSDFSSDDNNDSQIQSMAGKV